MAGAAVQVNILYGWIPTTSVGTSTGTPTATRRLIQSRLGLVLMTDVRM